MAEPVSPPDLGPSAPSFDRADYHAELPDSHGHFARGLVFGIGGALVGMALYATVGIITGLEIGYVSLAVGFIVGKAILMGSAGRRGRRYQVAAIALTYVAVSMSSVPIMVNQVLKTRDESAAPSASSASPPAPSGEAPAPTFSPERAASAIGILVMIGLASPFLQLSSPVSGLIGLVILFVGMQIAWRMTGAVPTTVAEALASRTPADDTPTSLNLNR
jgi:hypothetical protein